MFRGSTAHFPRVVAIDTLGGSGVCYPLFMKRHILSVAAIVLLGAGLFACSKQGTPSASTATNDAAFADFVPADAVVSLAVPDVKRARAAWKTSSIYQIWLEPEMQAFLTKPLAKLPQSPELNTLLDKLEAVEARNVFISLISLTSDRPQLVAGFAFKGDAAALESLLAKPKAEMLKSNPDGKAGSVPYGNRTIETFEAQRMTVATVVSNGWFFVATDLALLKGVLDRVDAKAEATPSLAKDADFKAAIARIPAGQETLAYFRAKPIVDKMLSFGAAFGRSISDEQKLELQKIRALAASTGFEKGKLRDTLFLLAPGLKKYPATLNLKSMPFTSAETMLFAAAIIKIPDDKEMAAADPVGQLGKSLAAAGLDVKDVRASFANEAALQLDWAQGALYPSPILSAELKDRAAALKLLAAATAQPPKDAEWITKTEDGVDYRILTQKKPSTPLSPTLALTATHFIAGISQMDVRSAVARAKGNGGHLDSNAGYKTAMGDVGKPEISVFYLDAKTLFEKLYGLGKSFTPYAQGTPVQEAVELEKLPATDTIAKHLAPVVFSSRETDNGILCESVGPLTLNQMLVTGAGLGALGASMYNGMMSPAHPPSRPPQVAPTPDASMTSPPAAPSTPPPKPGN
jgi:hypothetical protein